MYFDKGTKQKEREEKNLRSKVISELVTDILPIRCIFYTSA